MHRDGDFLNELTELFEGDSVVDFEETDISYVELEELYEYVLAVYKGRYNTASLSFKDSKIILNVPNGTRMPYSTVDKHIIFENGTTDIKQQAVEVSGGLPIYHNISGVNTWTLHATTGICSKKGNAGYLITAGHVVTQVSHPLIDIKTANGILNKSNAIVNEGTDPAYPGDYAIIPLNSSLHTATSKFNNGTTIQSAGTWSYGRCGLDIPNGTVIFKYGAVTGLTSGLLNARTSYTTSAGVTIYGVAQITHETTRVSLTGDSGSTMWYLNSLGTRVICGILSGGSGTGKVNIGNKDYYVAYYTPFYYVYESGFMPFVQ